MAEVTAVLGAADLEKAHFWCYSMGGWIGFGMARHAAVPELAMMSEGRGPKVQARPLPPLAAPKPHAGPMVLGAEKFDALGLVSDHQSAS
jgi:pimeloyl-ACP methyl ester carboxylesterase